IVKYKSLAKNLCPQCGIGKRIEKPAKRRETTSWVGRSNMMNCGMIATVIEDYGYHDITIQFEDGLIRQHCRKDRFKSGAIAHKS
ncbi:MAG: hypothetical protein IKX86_03915, partial [Clostridia bacterium]|nr:hypothetical protein [Clostridia bacterium]